MSGAAFLFTRDPQARNGWDDARPLVRSNLGDESLVGAAKTAAGQGLLEFEGTRLRIDRDVVLIMIGNTQELLDSCKAAEGTVEWLSTRPTAETLQIWYDRQTVHVVSRQRDTLLLVGSQSGYWSPAPTAFYSGADFKKDNPLRGEIRFLDNEPKQASADCIPDVLRWIRETRG
jgi:hypothetical protein